MKSSISHYGPRLILGSLLATLVFGFGLGCSDDEKPPTNGSESKLTVENIVLNPKSVTQGDTIQCTAVITSSGQSGFAQVQWSANGGSFLQTTQSSVGWVATDPTGVYRLTVTATNSVNSSSKSADVFVGDITTMVSGGAGEIVLNAAGSGFYYLYSPVVPTDPTFIGFVIYESTGGAGTPVVAGAIPGTRYRFSADLGRAVHTRTTFPIDPLNILLPVNVWLTDLAGRTQTAITTDQAAPGSTRRHQHLYPTFSPSGSWVTYEAFRPNPQAGSIDTFDVCVYDINTQQTVNVTATHNVRGQRRNFFPTFSSDGNWLVFISDRVQFNQWELFGVPISGGVVDTMLAAVDTLTSTGGLMAELSQSAEVVKNPRKTWNPNPATPVLAIVGADGMLRLVQMTAGGAITTEVALEGNVREMVWAPGGGSLAVSTGSKVQLVALGGVATSRHTAVSGDALVDLTWSPNGDFLFYRAQRGSGSWFELLDIDAGTNYTTSVVITPTDPVGSRPDYAGVCSTASAWAADNVVYMLLFGGTTASIAAVDISGATP